MKQESIVLTDDITVEPQGVVNGIAYFSDVEAENYDLATRVTFSSSSSVRSTLFKTTSRLTIPNICEEGDACRATVLDLGTVEVKVSTPKASTRTSRELLLKALRGLIDSGVFESTVVNQDRIA